MKESDIEVSLPYESWIDITQALWDASALADKNAKQYTTEKDKYIKDSFIEDSLSYAKLARYLSAYVITRKFKD